MCRVRARHRRDAPAHPAGRARTSQGAAQLLGHTAGSLQAVHPRGSHRRLEALRGKQCGNREREDESFSSGGPASNILSSPPLSDTAVRETRCCWCRVHPMASADDTWRVLHSHLCALSLELHSAEQELSTPVLERLLQLVTRRGGAQELPRVAVVAVRQGREARSRVFGAPRALRQRIPTAWRQKPQQGVLALELPIQVRHFTGGERTRACLGLPADA